MKQALEMSLKLEQEKQE